MYVDQIELDLNWLTTGMVKMCFSGLIYFTLPGRIRISPRLNQLNGFEQLRLSKGRLTDCLTQVMCSRED